jgi:type II secretory pathway predicted ATPase ExeA
VAEVVGHSGSVIDFYRALCLAMGEEDRSNSRTLILKRFRGAIENIVQGKKQKVLLVIDEASLLRDDVFSEIHAAMQFACDSKRLFGVVFAGQVQLLDKLSQRRAAPLASRVIAKAHMSAIDRPTMAEYLMHHIKLVGGKRSVFSEQATTAIHQGSGGFLRKANSLAKGAIIAASIDKVDLVDAEHVRIAATELLV